MRFYKTQNKYKASNVSFNPTTKQAYSYGWWKFVDVVEGKVIFNNYRFSNSTSKHQYKVARLMDQLGIKIDITMPLPNGILKTGESSYRSGYEAKGLSLSEMIVEAEETLCDQFLRDIVKKQERYERAKLKKFRAKIESKLENDFHFRDYEIRDAKQFGTYNKVAVHQVISKDSIDGDIENAIYNFQRDGFGSIVFYVEV